MDRSLVKPPFAAIPHRRQVGCQRRRMLPRYRGAERADVAIPPKPRATEVEFHRRRSRTGGIPASALRAAQPAAGKPVHRTRSVPPRVIRGAGADLETALTKPRAHVSSVGGDDSSPRVQGSAGPPAGAGHSRMRLAVFVHARPPGPFDSPFRQPQSSPMAQRATH
jgi:hypothetical protein